MVSIRPGVIFLLVFHKVPFLVPSCFSFILTLCVPTYFILSTKDVYIRRRVLSLTTVRKHYSNQGRIYTFYSSSPSTKQIHSCNHGNFEGKKCFFATRHIFSKYNASLESYHLYVYYSLT